MPKTLEQMLAELSPDDAGRVTATLRAGALMQHMLADADAARTIIPLTDKVAKKLNPGHMTVEEQAAPIVARVREEFQEELSKRDKKAAEDRAVSDLNDQIADAKANHGFTDEGIANVLKRMQDKGVGDFGEALKAYRYDNPAPSATPERGSDAMDWNFYNEIQSGDLKTFFDGSATHSPSLVDDPEKWARAAGIKYLNNEIGLPQG